MDYYGWSMMGGWGGIIMMLIAFITWVIIIGGIIYLIWHLTKRNYRGPEKDFAIKIVQERYAKGEINRQEFEEKMKDLK